MDKVSRPEIVLGKIDDTDAFLTDHQLFLLGKSIHRIARLEQFITDWTSSLSQAAGGSMPEGSKPQVIEELKKALDRAPDEFKQFDIQKFAEDVQMLFEYRHFLAHGRAVIDKVGDLSLRKTRSVGKVRKDPTRIQTETLVITDQTLEFMIAKATNLDLFVAGQRQLFKPDHERAKAIFVHPGDGRIIIAKEIATGRIVSG